MNIYIATGLERGEEAKALAAKLSGLGHAITYAWWEHGSVQDDGPDKIRDVSIAEVDGVCGADLFIALLPGARGTHTEFGIALSQKRRRPTGERNRVDESPKLIALVGPTEVDGRTCAFYLHPLVDERFDTVGELLSWLRGMARTT